jgi:hypothetical protein
MRRPILVCVWNISINIMWKTDYTLRCSPFEVPSQLQQIIISKQKKVVPVTLESSHLCSETHYYIYLNNDTCWESNSSIEYIILSFEEL